MADLLDRLQAAVGDTYRIQRELGGGGMSRVYLAEEVDLGRQVVIKLLPPEMGAGVNVDRFRREIQLAAKLQHPHIVPLLTAGSQDDLLYYVMPFIEGESLRAKLVREGELPVNETLRILRDVLDALSHAHQHNVVHRDIKPDNVLLSGKHAVVTDFGVAKAVSSSTGETSLTSLGVALGTPAYMAPEQAAANPNVDHRADIYAVGVLAYEMLSGEPPFTGPNPQAILSAHVMETPPAVTTHREAVPGALNEFVMRCLEKKPADRWQRAEEMIPHVEAMLTPSGGVTPTATQPVPAVDYDAKAEQAHPVRVAGLFGLASIGVLAIVYFLVQLIGLPHWVTLGAVGLLGLGLPIMMLTGHHERRRAMASSTGLHVATPTGVQRHLTWRKSVLGGGLAFAGLGVVTAGYVITRALGIGPAATLVTAGIFEERDRIVLAQFENRTSDSTLGETVTDLFRIDLAQSRAVVVMEPRQVADVLGRMGREPDIGLTADLATEVAQREGLKAVLTGEVLPVGNGFVISTRLTRTSTGDVLWADRETAAMAADLMAAVDRLSAKLRERIGESLRSIRAEEPMWRYTTSSVGALRKYTQGNRANDEGDFESAKTLLQEAVALDSNFAMAWRKLAVVYSNTGEPPERFLPAYTRAYELRERLTERERLRVEEIYYGAVELDRSKRISALRRLVDLYPDDRAGLNNLALSYGRLRRWNDAEEWYRRAAEIDVAVAYGGLIEVQAAQGKYAAADSTLERYAQRFPDNPQVEFRRALLASSQGDYETAERHLRALREARRGNLIVEQFAGFELARLNYARGKLATGQRNLADGFASQEQRGLLPAGTAFEKAFVEGYVDLWIRDDPGKAIQRVDSLLGRYPLDSLDVEDRPYLGLADLYASAGRPDLARPWLAAHERELSDWYRKAQETDYLDARGAIELAEGRFAEAIASYREAHDLGSDPIARLFLLGLAFDRSGQVDSALAYYEEFLSTPYLFRGRDPTRKAIVYRRLGSLYEERGDSEKAVEYYNRFVDLWAEADAELQPRVAEIRDRIVNLVGEGR
ncbi:MAG: protein kinase [Gemmatimonadetes bacterium]|nr:protein kinase [Gemmatimonadota bacterium]